jgi:hypothetical protein
MGAMPRIAVLGAVAGLMVAVVGAASPVAAAAPPDVSPVKVAASRLGEGHAVYVRGTDGRIWWRTVEAFKSPDYSTRWRPLSGVVASGPDVAQVSSTELWLAARSTGSNLLVRRQSGATFGSWENLGGTITSAPVLMVETGTPRTWAFARGGDGAVWYRVRGGDAVWAPWRTIGGWLTSAADAVYYGFGPSVVVQGRGLDGVIWGRVLDIPSGTWSPWEVAGERTTSATSTVRSDRVFGITYWRGLKNQVLGIVDGPEPFDLGGVATSAPDASYGGEIVAVRGTDNALWARVNGGPWQSLGGRVA